jgi:excisionase family DNA binding protein
MEGYLTRKEACDILKIHYNTLYKMAENKLIDSVVIGHQRMYNVKKYLNEKGISQQLSTKRRICYCRVSSQKQKEDLTRQVEYMKKEYPYHEILIDIASGLNYERAGLKKLLTYAMDGELEEVVISFKDRLTRFGYEMIEWIIKEKSNGKIKVLNNNEEMTPTEEISKDIVAIMNVYTAKINGLRKYKKQITNELLNTQKEIKLQ